MTKTNIILNGENVTISATCKGTANAFGDNLQHYKFYVTIRTSNETAHFYFYYSFANWQKGITELSEDELLMLSIAFCRMLLVTMAQQISRIFAKSLVILILASTKPH